MISFFKRTKGVISVFLILILVPTMVFSAVLVDGSRMVSARAITQEAADLAAFSVLSGYNATLKEEFGLFALKDVSDVQKVYEESLKATLQASGLDGQTYSEKVWDVLKGTIGMNNPYQGKNFLNLYDFQLDQSSVTPLYTLANPEVLQNQIVEYSKYRGLYVIAERLGLLNSIADIAKQAEEQEKTADAMEEKMEIDEKNGKADEKVRTVQEYLETFNSELSGMDGQKYTFFQYLTAEMTVLAGVGEISRETKDAAKEYNRILGETKNYFSKMDDTAFSLKESLLPAKNDVESAISRLDGYIGKYSGTDNETIKELLQDAKNSKEAYQKCLEDLKAVESDTTLNTWTTNHIGSGIAGVAGNIDLAVSRYSGEKDEDDEDDAYQFYYYDSDSSTEDGGEARGDYSDVWNDTLSVAVDSQVPSVTSSNSYYNEGESGSGEDKREQAKEQSGSQEKVEEMKSESDSQSIDQNIYKLLPSKTFDPKAEADSYGAILAEDLGRTVSGGNSIDITEDSPASMKQDFYNESGDLSGSKSILESGKDSFLSGLKDVAETARDEVLTLSYIFGTFKTRMTGNEKFRKGAIAEDKLDKFYIVPWRYLYEGGEQDLQFSPKSDRKTRLNAEIEYLIYGCSSDAENEAAVYATIYAPRMVNNMIALYQNKKVKNSCKAAAEVASAATMETVPSTVFFWIFLTAWTIAETILDMHYLIDEGYRIPLFKKKDTILLELDFSSGESAELVEHYRSDSGSDKNIYVSYEDYLLLLLLLKSSQKRLMRTADLIELDMQMQEENFRIEEAYTYIRAKSNLSIRYLFINTPAFSGEYSKTGLRGRLQFENVIYQGY